MQFVSSPSCAWAAQEHGMSSLYLLLRGQERMAESKVRLISVETRAGRPGDL